MKATTAANRDHATQQPVKFTSTYKSVKASIASVLMWLSMVGGLL